MLLSDFPIRITCITSMRNRKTKQKLVFHGSLTITVACYIRNSNRLVLEHLQTRKGSHRWAYVHDMRISLDVHKLFHFDRTTFWNLQTQFVLPEPSQLKSTKYRLWLLKKSKVTFLRNIFIQTTSFCNII